MDSQARIDAARSLPFVAKPKGAHDYRGHRNLLETLPGAMEAMIKAADGYDDCELSSREIYNFFKHYVKGPGGPYSGPGPCGGAIWYAAKLEIQLSFDGAFDNGLLEAIKKDLRELRGKCGGDPEMLSDAAERERSIHGTVLFAWIDDVKAKAKSSGMATSHVHIPIYNYNSKDLEAGGSAVGNRRPVQLPRRRRPRAEAPEPPVVGPPLPGRTPSGARPLQ